MNTVKTFNHYNMCSKIEGCLRWNYVKEITNIYIYFFFFFFFLNTETEINGRFPDAKFDSC